MDARLQEILSRRLSGVPAAKPTPTRIDNLSIETSDTALIVDRWNVRRGEELADDTFSANLMSDCHTAMFDPEPQLAEHPEDKHRSKWFADLLASDDYIASHVNTMCDKGLSEIAACAIAERYIEWRKDQPDDDEPDDSLEGDLKRMQSVAGAMEQAQEDCENAEAFARGIGKEPNVNGQIDPVALVNAVKRMQDNEQLKQIFMWAGRFRRYAAAAQKSKAKHGYDDMIGVRLDGEVGKLTTSELAKLGIEELELDLLRRITERQAMCREYQGEEKVAMGPIVVLVDESGSMYGEPIIKAKALALTLAWVAQQQNRWIAFSSFTSSPYGRTLCMPPGKWNQQTLIEWISAFDDGGTELTLLLDTLPNQYWAEFGCPKGKTDIITITDAAVRANPRLVKSFNQWRKDNQVKSYGLILDASPGDLRLVCDANWCLDDLDLSSDGVKQVLSI